MQQVQASIPGVLPLGSDDPADLVVPEVLVADRNATGAFGRPLLMNDNASP